MSEIIRIGAFAKRFNVPASTVRYYIQRGILVPESRNGQYLFSAKSISDMEQVVNFKSMRFTLDDIHELLTQMRKFNFAQGDDIAPFLSLLYKQRKRLSDELNELHQQKAHLEQLKQLLMP